MAGPEEIGGIAVTIQANIGPLMQKIEQANQAIQSLATDTQVTIRAGADSGSVKTAIESLRAEINKEAKGKLRDQEIKVSLRASKVIAPKGEIIVPVTFKWNGRWAGGQPPEPEVGVRPRPGGPKSGPKGGGQTLAEDQGTPEPAPRSRPRRAAAVSEPVQAEAPVRPPKQPAAEVEPAKPARRAKETAPAPAASAPVHATGVETCPICQQQIPTVGKDLHMQWHVGRGELKKQAAPKAPRTQPAAKTTADDAALSRLRAEGARRTSLEEGTLQRQQQAGVTGRRGILRTADDPEVAAFRASLAEGAGLRRTTQDLFPAEQGAPALRRLRDLGLDIPSAREGVFQPREGLSGEELSGFYQAFPNLRPGPPTKLTGKGRRREQARVKSRERLFDRFRGAQFAGPRSADPRAARFARLIGLPPSEEFEAIRPFVTSVFEQGPEGLERIGSKLNLPEGLLGGVGKRLEGLQGIFEGGTSGEQVDLGAMSDLIKEAYTVRRDITELLATRGARSRQKKAAKIEAAGGEVPEGFVAGGGAKGRRRVRKLVGEGRRIARQITGPVDLAVMAAQGQIKAAGRPIAMAGEQEVQEDITEQVKATREANKPAAGRLVQHKVPTGPRAIRRISEEINLLQARMDALVDRIAERKEKGLGADWDESAIRNLQEQQDVLTASLTRGGQEAIAEPPKGEREAREAPIQIDPRANAKAAEAIERAEKHATSLSKRLQKATKSIKKMAVPEFMPSEEEFAQRAQERARAREEARFGRGEPPVRQFTGGVTGGEGLPVQKIIEENAALKRAASEAQARRSEAGKRAAATRAERQAAAESMTFDPDAGRFRGAGGRFVPPPAGTTGPGGGLGGGAMRVFVVNWPTALRAVAGAPVSAEAAERIRRFTPRQMRERQLAGEMIAPGTPRVAGGIDIETGEEEKEKEPKLSRAGRGTGLGGLRSAVDVAAAEDVAENVRKETQGFMDVANEARTFASQVVQENPVRALSVAVGQVLVNTIGGRATLIKQQKNIDREAGELQKAATLYGRALDRQKLAEERLVELRGGETERFVGEAGRLERILGTEEEPGALRRVAARRREAAETQQGVVGRERAALQGQRVARGFATLGVGTVGIVGGTLLFQAAMQAAQLGLQQVGLAAERVTDSLTNFEQKTGLLVTALGDAARANYGNVQATVSSKIALSGLGDASADLIRPLLEQRSTVTAGTKALEEQNDLLRAARNIREGQLGGLDVRGLTQTTGGFPLFQVGGQRAPAEIIGNMIGSAIEIPVNPVPETPIDAASLGLSIAQVFASGPQGLTKSEDLLRLVEPAAGKLTETINILNEDAEKAGSAFQLVAATEEQQLAMAELFKDAIRLFPDAEGELRDFQKDLDKAGLALADFSGQTPTQGGALFRFLDSVTRGALKPNARELVASQAQQVSAQLQLTAAQGQLERQQLIPIQQFVAQLSRGRVGIRGQQQPGFGLTEVLPEEFAGQAENFGQIKGEIDDINARLSVSASTGREAAMEMLRFADTRISGATGQVSNLTGEFQALTLSISQSGKRIRELELSNIWQQVNVQTAQYDEQLRVANRSLADAQEMLTGIRQKNSDGLGVLQHQTRELEKQNTLIGFQLSELGFIQAQRQINFQTAIAGFTAPGVTPEERAARIKEAKIQADFAQKQLNLQKEQFEIAKRLFDIAQGGGGIIDIQLGRQVEDIKNQIGLITQARQVTINVAVNQEAIAAYQEVLQADLATVQSILNEATSVEQQMLQQQASLTANLGGFMSEYANTIVFGLNDYFRRVNGVVAGQLEQITGRRGGPQEGANQFQTGFFGSVSRPTQMIVGEAGTEAVAILRNPREMTLGGGGGGGSPIQIYMPVTVTGNKIAADDEGEIVMWAEKLTRMVEERLGRRASLQGLRGI